MRKFTVSLLATCLLLLSTGCIHTARVKNLYNYGAQLKSTDVVLFTGFNGQDSRTAKSMLSITENMLKKQGIRVLYHHNQDFNYDFATAGLQATNFHLDNDLFIDNMVSVYGLTHLFSVGYASEYQGNTMPLNKGVIPQDDSQLVFEVYSVVEEKVVASMHLTGSTIHLFSIHDDPDDRTYGNIYKNYRKGLRKLLKASKLWWKIGIGWTARSGLTDQFCLVSSGYYTSVHIPDGTRYPTCFF